jgi:hypothetical protein
VLVQEQRFLSGAIEHKRIAPLQARHDLAFARFLHQQVVDGFLIERVRRCHADVDLFRLLLRVSQEPRMDEMVMKHHVGGFQTTEASDCDQSRVAGARADQVDDGSHVR